MILRAIYAMLPKWMLLSMMGIMGVLLVTQRLDATRRTIELQKARITVAEQAAAIAQANAKAAADTAILTRKLLDAQNEANKLKSVHAAETASLRRERDGLRSDIAAYRSTYRFTGSSPSAAANAADTFADLFSQCTDRYTELAGKADGHVIDIKTLTAAWPNLKTQ